MFTVVVGGGGDREAGTRRKGVGKKAEKEGLGSGIPKVMGIRENRKKVHSILQLKCPVKKGHK